MTNLSPAAQAVFWAFNSKFDWIEDGVPGPQFKALAAALRAVADYAQRSSYAAAPSTDWGDGWKAGISDTAQGLFAIADELEALPE